MILTIYQELELLHLRQSKGVCKMNNNEQQVEKTFYKVEDIEEILNVSTSSAYKIIRDLNKELDEKGFLTISGRISKKYFDSKMFM